LGDKEKLQELKSMLQPLAEFGTSMQGCMKPLQIDCILQMFQLYDDLLPEKYHHNEVKAMTSNIREALASRYRVMFCFGSFDNVYLGILNGT
jgi:hypothetical protein